MTNPHGVPSPFRIAALAAASLLLLGLWPACQPKAVVEDPDAGGADSGEAEDAGGGDAGSIVDGGTSLCSPTAQTGCTAPNTKCGLVGDHFGCQAPGTAAQGDACTSNGTSDTCQAGLFCFNGTCARFCDQALGANACPAGQSCSLQITWNGGPPNGERFFSCVATGSDCNPGKQDCSNAAQGCYVTNAGNKCLNPGTTADGMTCASANDCRKGSTCFQVGAGTDFKCYRLCAVAGSDAGTADGGAADAGAACPTGTCTPIGDGAGVCT